jgi:hypothetical protein
MLLRDGSMCMLTSASGQSRRFDHVQLTSGLTPQADIVADRRHVSKVPGTEVATTFMCMHYRWPRCVDDRSRSIRQEPIQGQVPTQFPLQLTEFLRVACSSSYLNPKLYQRRS